MRNLNTSAVTSSNGLPVKAGSLVHLQLAYKEAMDALAKSIVINYAPNTLYRLFGCINSGTTTDYNISAGAVYYNGEIYLVDAAVFSVSGANVAVATIVTTYFTDPTADPVTFTDGVARSVHEIKKVVIAGGLSGSGISDFSNFKRTNRGRTPKGTILPYYPPTNDLSEFDSTGKGIAINTLGWAICNGSNGTPNMKGRVIAGYDPSDPDFNNVGKTAGEKAHTLTMQELPAAGVDVVAYDGTPISFGASLAGAGDKHRVRTDVDANYGPVGYKTANLGMGLSHNNMQPYTVLVYITEID